ncbi:hypothetical protein D3C74_439270 [compost metagenome]
MSGKTHRFTSDFFRHASEFEHNLARFNYGYPFLNVTFTTTHTNLKRLLSNRLIWENLDPNLTTTFDVTCHCNTGSFDLTVSDPRWFQSLQAEFAEVKLSTAFCHTLHVTALLLAVFNAFWYQHD